MGAIKRSLKILVLYLLLDFLVISIAYMVTEGLVTKGELFFLPPWIRSGVNLQLPSFIPSNPVFVFVMSPFLISLLYSGGFYETRRGERYSHEFHGIARAVFLAALFSIALDYLFLLAEVSRSFIGIYSLLVFSGLFTWRLLKRKSLEHLVSMGFKRTRTLIIGAGKMGRYLEMMFRKKGWLGVDVVGFLDDRFGLDEEGMEGVLGRVEEYGEIVKQYDVREIYITIPSERKIVPRIVDLSNELGVIVKVVPEMYDLLASEVRLENVGSLPVMKLCVPTLRPGQVFIKRGLELVLTVPFLIVLSPLFALIAVAIKLGSEGSVFFKQPVLGLNGEASFIYKFRSMVNDADDSKHRDYLEKFVKSNEPADTDSGMYKLSNDDRITRVGRILRKYSLDELPQLWNVLRGDLSLVGPRPPIPYEYIHYNDYHRKRLLVKSGVTGLWQVSGKNRLSFESMVMLDILYINDWSIWMDLKIILDTIPVIFRGDNV